MLACRASLAAAPGIVSRSAMRPETQMLLLLLRPVPILLLCSLQGKVTPRLFCHGRLSLTDAFFLALSDEGQDLSVHPVCLTRELRRQVEEAVCALHEAGMCHRDVRAHNILLRDDGAVRIVDFERARFLQQPWSELDRANVQADLHGVQQL